MRTSIFIAAAVAASVLALAAARCPSACSGHGVCGRDDKCTCYKNWQAADCADRTCEFGLAWATEHTNDPHYYAECSAKGICDRATGECACFEGYTGVSCKRSVCPNDCSGHGKCRLVQDLPLANTIAYTQWDAAKIQVCMCDGGYTGPDCSQRLCPRGDDPMTECAELAVPPLKSIHTIVLTGGDSSVLMGNIATTVTVGGVTGKTLSGQITLHFKDTVGEEWITNRIEGAVKAPAGASTGSTTFAAAIKTALQALPNYRVPEVTVEVVDVLGLGVVGTRTITVTFTDARVTGDQNTLWLDSPLGCHVAGCHPMYRQPMYTVIIAPVAGDAGGVTAPATTVALTYVVDLNTVWKVSTDSLLDLGAPNTVTPGGWYQACVKVWLSAGDGTTPDSLPNHLYEVLFNAGTTCVGGTPTIPKSSLPDVWASGASYATTYITGGGSVGTTNTAARKVPIGWGMYLEVPATMYNGDVVGVAGDYFMFKVNVEVMSAAVTRNTVDVSVEDAECSNRGACDRTTGMCACYEGYYQDNCGLQTILV